MTSSNFHLPVLANELIANLAINPNGFYVDCTCGRGGHSDLILKSLSNKGLLICLDQDAEAIKFLKNKFKNALNVKIFKANFSQLKTILNHLKIDSVDGIIYDLGVSSPMFDDPLRGFSYQTCGTLDMRMDQTADLTAKLIVNSYPPQRLKAIFKNYGEIFQPQFVVNAIVKHRLIKPIETTSELVEIIKAALPKAKLYTKKHPARQYFQALRIAVNNELENLTESLQQAISLLKGGGRIVVITFHSLEDRIVKQLFKSLITDKIPKEVPIKNIEFAYFLPHKKPIVPSNDEIDQNHRARSAKLRVLVKKAKE